MPTVRSRYALFLMFAIFLLLNLDFTILRSVRTTLAVVDLGGGAHSVPLYELFGAMPGAFLMTAALAWLLNRFSIQRVFFLTLAVFLGFFFCFVTLLYPYLLVLKQSGEDSWHIISISSMVFFSMSELWKPALPVILFWGLVNQYFPVLEAKKLYAPLMLGGSLGSVFAGPIISGCTSERLWKSFPVAAEHWNHSLVLMMGVILVIGIIAGVMYHLLSKFLSQCHQDGRGVSSSEIVVKKSVSMSNILECWHSPQLRLLSWMVIADYIAYSLGEVIFLDVLKRHLPNSVSYCDYMGKLSLWSGLLTVLSSLLITPYLLQRKRWVIAASVTPVCLLLTMGLFFITLWSGSLGELWFQWSKAEWIAVAVVLGSLQYCTCRAAKYSLFDSSKELTFVMMQDSQRMPGKLVIDGLCARFGRGCSSLLSIGLIKLSGGVLASAGLTGVIGLGIAFSWFTNTLRLGKLIDQPKQEPQAE